MKTVQHCAYWESSFQTYLLFCVVISINANLHFTTEPAARRAQERSQLEGALNNLTGARRLRHSCATK